jgi:hypothetical protein
MLIRQRHLINWAEVLVFFKARVTLRKTTIKNRKYPAILCAYNAALDSIQNDPELAAYGPKKALAELREGQVIQHMKDRCGRSFVDDRGRVGGTSVVLFGSDASQSIPQKAEALSSILTARALERRSP